MSNHMIIGLGGTGGRIAKGVRLSLKANNPDWDLGICPISGDKNVRVQFLYVDSDVNELNTDSWQIFGQSVGLTESQKVYLTQCADVASMVSDEKNIPWIGDEKLVTDILSTCNSAKTGANRIRHFGRSLLAHSINSFAGKTQSLVNQLQTQDGGRMGCTFHLCCTTGCGTGSGSLIDAAVQIRSKYPDATAYPIRVYGLIESKEGDNTKGNFFGNQYALLLELNALMTAKYFPHNLATGERVSKDLKFIDSVYLLSSTNENQLGINYPGQEKLVADYLAFRISCIDSNSIDKNSIKKLLDAETSQDLAGFTEEGEKRERSLKFSTLGFRKWQVPDQLIQEKLSWDYAHQAAKQMLFNCWIEGSGYVPQSQEKDYVAIVKEEGFKNSCQILDRQLTLSSDMAVLEGQNKDELDFSAYWNRNITSLSSTILGQYKSNEWTSQMDQSCGQLESSGFRNAGVANYFNAKAQNLEAYCNNVTKAIERQLYLKWESGEEGFIGVKKILDAIIAENKDKSNLYSKKIAENETKIKNHNVQLSELKSKISNGNGGKMVGLGLVGAVVGAGGGFYLGDIPGAIVGALLGGGGGAVIANVANPLDALFTEYSSELINKQICFTERHGYEFGRSLLEKVDLRLKKLSEQLQASVVVFTELMKKAEAEAANRNFNKKDHDLSDLYEVDKSKLEAALTEIRGSKEKISTKIKDLRSKFRSHFESSGFSGVQARAEFVWVGMEADFNLHAESLHAEIVHSHSKVIGVDIIDALDRKYLGKPNELQADIKEFISRSACYMTFDDNQKSGFQANENNHEPKKRFMYVFLPKIKEGKETFCTQLRKAFESQAGSQVTILDSNKGNEIVIVNMASLLPLRYFAPVKELKVKYEALLKNDAQRARTELCLHLEPNPRLNCPSLYELKSSEIVEQARVYVLYADALGMLQIRMNEELGKEIYYFVDRDGGRSKSTALQDNLVACEKMSPSHFVELKSRIHEILPERKRLAQHRTELKESLNKSLEKVLVLKSGDDTHQDYKNYLKAYDEAINMLNTKES